MGIKCIDTRQRNKPYNKSFNSSYITHSNNNNSYFKNLSQTIRAETNAIKENKNNFSNDNINNSISDIDIVLDNHNKIRNKYKLKKLELNDELNELAQKYADKCAETESLDHCPCLYKGQVIGENIREINYGNYDLSKICDIWNNEEKNYDFSNPIFKSDCSHFTQIIWKGTASVGFGISTSASGKRYFVAFYFPAGNIFDKFKENIPIS